jgi:hypothetical protein
MTNDSSKIAMEARNSDESEKIDRRFMDQLLALSKKPGIRIDHDVVQWMQSRGFARPQDLVADGKMGGWVITQKGRNWLAITKYAGWRSAGRGSRPWRSATHASCFRIRIPSEIRRWPWKKSNRNTEVSLLPSARRTIVRADRPLPC